MSENSFHLSEFITWARSRGASSEGHSQLSAGDRERQEVANKMYAFSMALEAEALDGNEVDLDTFFTELTKRLLDAGLIEEGQDWTDYSYSYGGTNQNFDKRSLKELENAAHDLLNQNRGAY